MESLFEFSIMSDLEIQQIQDLIKNEVREPDFLPFIEAEIDPLVSEVRARLARLLTMDSSVTVERIVSEVVQEWCEAKVKAFCYVRYKKLMLDQGYSTVAEKNFNLAERGRLTPYGRFRFLEKNKVGLGTRLRLNSGKIVTVAGITQKVHLVVQDNETGQKKTCLYLDSMVTVA